MIAQPPTARPEIQMPVSKALGIFAALDEYHRRTAERLRDQCGDMVAELMLESLDRAKAVTLEFLAPLTTPAAGSGNEYSRRLLNEFLAALRLPQAVCNAPQAIP